MRGYSSEAVTGTSALSPEAVTPLLEGRFGTPYLYREVCLSTQELVRDLPEGAVAATDNQTAGRGRRGRQWLSEPGTGVLFSLSLWPGTPAERLAPFSLVLAEAVCEALDERAMVRWPNDVLVDGRKLAGVLRAIERRYDDFERRGFAGLERDELAGRRVRLAGGADGTVDGIDSEGRLVVDGVAHASAEVERVEVSP
jgi:biotin-(acetyl-CoA carboxylase) ligase